MSHGADPQPLQGTGNPYAAEYMEAKPFAPAVPKPPVFSQVMFVVSLLFSLLRIPAALLSAYAVFAVNLNNAPMQLTGPYELATSAGIVLFGLAANILLLMRKDIGIPLAWCLVAFVVMSLGVAVWQLSLMMQTAPEGSPERVGMMVGAGFVMMVRLALLALYIAAVVTFARWKRGVGARV
jgi:hypothetical protein